MMKLDIGSGPFPAVGYTTVDAYCDADIKAFMWNLPLEDDSVDTIRSVHSLEHVSKHEVLKTLVEWKRVLKPNGLLHIEVPDLRYACKQWLDTQGNGLDLDFIFGLQTHEGEMHRTGFTPKLLTDYLSQAGFVEITTAIIWSHEQESIVAKSLRPEA